MLFVSIKLLWAGKGFCEIFLPVLNIVVYYPRLTNLHMCNIRLHVLKVSLILFSAHRGSYLRSLPLLGFGFGRTGLTKFVWPFQKCRQNLAQFFKGGSTESLRHRKLFVNHKCQSHRNKHQILRLKIEIKIFLIDIFLQIIIIMACKLTNLSDFTSNKNLSSSQAGRVW